MQDSNEARQAVLDLREVILRPAGYRVFIRLLHSFGYGSQMTVSEEAVILHNLSNNILAAIQEADPQTCIDMIAELRGILPLVSTNQEKTNA